LPVNRRLFLRGLLQKSLPLAAFATLAPLASGQARPGRAAATGAVTAPAVAAHYAELVHANYQDTLAAARELQAAIAALVARPTEAGLAKAREAWLAARDWYGQTEAFRFYGGPIDAEDGPEGRLNAWPLDESYIDGVPEQPEAGLINDRKVAITKAALAENNERGGEENISTGWHAIEFLLWGQDLDDDGPGARPFTDFVEGGKPNADRRRQYLEVVTELLVDDLTAVTDAWAPGRSNYRADFEKGAMESVRRIIVGIGSLSRGELAGERLEVAMSTQDQEDEHSCFSDNTHRDVVANALGIANVWLGRYRRRDGTVLEGPSLRGLVSAADPAMADRTTRQIAASLDAANAIQAPFDREIVGGDDAPGRLRIRKTVDSLVQQSKDLVESATAIGITRLTLTAP
jgi:putative iron-regulated protein